MDAPQEESKRRKYAYSLPNNTGRENSGVRFQRDGCEQSSSLAMELIIYSECSYCRVHLRALACK